MSQKLLDDLKRKNEKLEEELKNCQELYSNLMDERGLESADSRRSFLLKAQIFQLERQCMLLSQAQSSRALIMKETENELIGLLQDFQKMLSEGPPGPNVTIGRGKLMNIIGSLHKLKNSLYRQSKLESADDLRIPSLMSKSKYAADQKPVTCLDICSGKLEHLNLKEVARLENKLSLLYKHLCSLKYQIQISIPQCQDMKNGNGATGNMLPVPERQLLGNALYNLQEACQLCTEELSDCCDELIYLSLLHPSAPWSVVRKTDEFGILNAEVIIKSLPIAIQKRHDVGQCIKTMCKAHSYIVHMNKLHMTAAKSQISYFEHIHKQQLDYVSSLFSGIAKAYEDCEREIVLTVREPITCILKSWDKLKADQSSKHLKEFLDIFKHHENAFITLSKLKSSEEHQETGTEELLQDFRGKLDAALHKLERKYRQNNEITQKNLDDYKLTHEEDVVQCLRALHVS